VKKLRIAAVTVLALALGTGAALHAREKTGKVEPLQASGTIEAREVQVGSLVGGRVETVQVEEGAVVKKGQPLVTLEAHLLDLSIREQKGRVAEMRARLALVRKGPRREELARARVDFANADSDARRFEALLAKGIVSPQQAESQRATAETKRQLLTELVNGSRNEDVAAAEASLEREEGRLAYLERQREETVVSAPADGVIQSIDLRPGDLVNANQAVARILEPSQVWVRVYVPEPRLGEVTMGMPARLAVDSFPGRRFAARVVEIGSRAEYTPKNVQTLDQRGDTVFAVKLAIEPAPELKAGMSATATIGGRS
jgi:multidrug resistance efflux pump